MPDLPSRVTAFRVRPPSAVLPVGSVLDFEATALYVDGEEKVAPTTMRWRIDSGAVGGSIEVTTGKLTIRKTPGTMVIRTTHPSSGLYALATVTAVETSGGETPPDDDENDPPPDPVVGLRAFGLSDLPTAGVGPFNCTIEPVLPSNVLGVLRVTKQNGRKVFILPGGPKQVFNSPRGTVDLPAYHANVNALAANATTKKAIGDALADGTIPGLYLFDEPHHKDRYGRVVTDAELKAICLLVQRHWPGAQMFMRMRASDVRETYHEKCGYWSAWALRKGPVERWLAEDVAACQRMGNAKLVVGMNVIDFVGSPQPGSPDTYTTPDQFYNYGRQLVEHPYPGIVAFMCWKYLRSWYDQPGMPEKVAALAARWHAAHP